MDKWPNFFIVGAQKAGTTSLYEYLRVISGIYFPLKKEPHYFDARTLSDDNIDLETIRDKNEYLNLFANAKDEKIIGEASPGYLRDPEAPKLIHKVSPNARILISLRDPVERAFSQYLMFHGKKHYRDSFHERIQKEIKKKISSKDSHIMLPLGLYFENVSKYIQIFGKKQVKIIIFEEFIQNTKKTINEILKFLELNHTISEFESEVHHPYTAIRGPVSFYLIKSKIVRKVAQNVLPASSRKFLSQNVLHQQPIKPKMEKDVRDFLISFYRDDVNKLQTLLGRKLPWVNFQNIEGFYRN